MNKMKRFSPSWKSSKLPKKQRKYRASAPLHVKKKFLSTPLSKDLRKKHSKRSVTIRTGDKVKIVKGDFKNKEGKVEKVDVKKTRIFISGIERAKKDGTKTTVPLKPACLLITELNLDDKRRIKIENDVKKKHPTKTQSKPENKEKK